MTLHSTVSERSYEHAGTNYAGVVETAKPSISVIGLGYVGAVSMACLSHLGFRMVGVDISREKVDAIGAGVSPIVEARLGELLKEGVEKNLITATQNLVAAVFETDVTFLSVGTPTSKDGGCDFTFVRQASRAIGQAIGMKSGYHVVVLRCSVPPGTTLDVVVPEIERHPVRSLERTSASALTRNSCVKASLLQTSLPRRRQLLVPPTRLPSALSPRFTALSTRT
jgi:UDP-glucose/GDP-mannose dehydrogenase family, NAD binding domain